MQCKYSEKRKDNNLNNSISEKRDLSNRKKKFIKEKSPYIDHKFKIKEIGREHV